MRRATVRAVQVGIALALLAGLLPLSSAAAADDDTPTRPMQLMSAQAQQPPGPAVGGGVAVAPGPPPPFIYGFFRDPLWPGPGQRFLAAECPIGVGLTIVHYCPGLPPLADQVALPPPVWPTDVRQCDPWFQYFPTCRRPLMED
jgi:hypothetical protein